MENQQLREKLAAELRRQSLPASYIERLLADGTITSPTFRMKGTQK